MLKRSCENEKVRDIDGAQESTRTVRTSSPPCGKLVCCCGSDISALIAPPTISKKKDLLLQMPHTTACVFVAVVRILSFYSDFIKLSVPDLLVIVYQYSCL